MWLKNDRKLTQNKTLNTHCACKAEITFKLCAVYTGGHTNSDDVSGMISQQAWVLQYHWHYECHDLWWLLGKYLDKRNRDYNYTMSPTYYELHILNVPNAL